MLFLDVLDQLKAEGKLVEIGRLGSEMGINPVYRLEHARAAPAGGSPRGRRGPGRRFYRGIDRQRRAEIHRLRLVRGAG